MAGPYILALLDCNLDLGCKFVVVGQGMLFLDVGWLSRGAWSGTPGGSGRSVHLEALLSQWWGWACGLGRADPPSGHDRSWFGALGQGCSPQHLPKEDPVDLPK